MITPLITHNHKLFTVQEIKSKPRTPALNPKYVNRNHKPDSNPAHTSTVKTGTPNPDSRKPVMDYYYSHMERDMCHIQNKGK